MSDNPFEVTKAVDFTDAQIAATWVDLPGGGFVTLADPKSPMPTFLVGGKGGGRTHLLRYFSYALQRLRHSEDLLAGVQADGYLGIYFRCEGLNSSRFAGKRQEAETWEAVFSYYTDIWLARLTVDLIADLRMTVPSQFDRDDLTGFAAAVLDLFDVDVTMSQDAGDPAHDLSATFERLQRDLDLAINNAALTHELDVRIGASPGRLVFGVPAAAARHLPALSGIVFAYLLDEFENLTIDQQRYVNTLLREKELPTTFLVGSRLFGLRTHATLSAGEENRQGSEFALVVLEDAYRAQSHQYGSFCSSIVLRRLHESGCEVGVRMRLDDFFEGPANDEQSLEERAALRVAEKTSQDPGTRPWLERLRQQLQASDHGYELSDVMSAVTFPKSPLHEKFAVFLLYRAWADGEELSGAAASVRVAVNGLLSGEEKSGKVATSYKHYRHDLYAQILNDLRLPQEYFGFREFVQMSGYLPRNLLVLLKQVTRWSLFLGEQPFRGDKVSLRAQREGVREASAWFLSDAKGLGRVGEETQFAIRRLASLFREMRFSDKPVEVSCSSFSTDRQGLSPAALNCLNEATSHSLILEVPNGRRDKNTHLLNHKYQLNPMLAPLFDLSSALRGSAVFTTADLNAIFDPAVSETQYEAVKRRILDRMKAPFFAKVPPQDAFKFE
jgi:hypothetical protein